MDKPECVWWRLTWAPEGRVIGTVFASSASKARRMAPMPYRKYLGEIGVERLSGKDGA